MEAFAATRSANLRQALLAPTKETQRQDEPGPVAILAPGDPPVPDDVEEQARAMILAGQAPPAAWRPFIRRLSFNGEITLRDVAPLAGLIALQTLDLTGTRVSDVSALDRLERLERYGRPGVRKARKPTHQLAHPRLHDGMHPSGQGVGLGDQVDGEIVQHPGSFRGHHRFHQAGCRDIHAGSSAGYK